MAINPQPREVDLIQGLFEDRHHEISVLAIKAVLEHTKRENAVATQCSPEDCNSSQQCKKITHQSFRRELG
jgi:hypothetical protein